MPVESDGDNGNLVQTTIRVDGKILSDLKSYLARANRNRKAGEKLTISGAVQTMAERLMAEGGTSLSSSIAPTNTPLPDEIEIEQVSRILADSVASHLL